MPTGSLQPPQDAQQADQLGIQLADSSAYDQQLPEPCGASSALLPSAQLESSLASIHTASTTRDSSKQTGMARRWLSPDSPIYNTLQQNSAPATLAAAAAEAPHDSLLGTLSAASIDADTLHSPRRALKGTVVASTNPYAGGVTPGLINIDSNAQTGFHVDVGGVALDFSADGNYMGAALGDLVGVGIARDRGYTIQLGGGNLLDLSVTKDAGLGIWFVNGLLNLNIDANGMWRLTTAASPGTIAETVASSPTAVTAVTVDDLIAATTTNSTGITTTATTSSTGSTTTNSGSSTSSTGTTAITTTASTKTSSSTGPFTSNSGSSASSSGLDNSRIASGGDYADYEAFGVQAAGSDTAAKNAASSSSGTTTSSTATSSSGTSVRAPCQGGTVVSVSGNKYKCKYIKASLVRVASGFSTYSNGIVARRR
eukprot:GHUV01005321.1.p1 GENE.GHUV01005321.1~~GHUV01005321.1.p1  ORF type:complete len:427 (+),score=144.24 GHUV01005321.1:504-1784(+)